MSGRNVELTREAGRLRRLGRSPEEIEAELLNHPGRNGLPLAEIRAIARSIGAKPPGPKIDRPADGWPSATHEFASRRGWPVSALETLGAIAKRHEVHFPMRMASGEVVGWRRRRADFRPFRGDTKAKAMSLKGSRAMLIMPARLPAEIPVAIAESETDAVAIIGAGHPAVVATPGGKPSPACIAELQKVVHGRTVVLFPDPDEVGDAWRRRLGGALLRVDCRVLLVPPIDCDIDERLKRDHDPHGSLAQLISVAIPFTEGAHHDPGHAAQEGAQRRLLPSPSNPMAVARKLIEEKYQTDTGLTLINHRDDFFRWDGACWPERDRLDIRRDAYAFTEGASYLDATGELQPFAPTVRKINDLIDALRACVGIASEHEPPVWLDGRANPPASEIIAMQNGLLHLPTRTVLPHTPRFFAHNALVFPFVAEAPEPVRWLDFLRQLWPDDHASIDVLQELFGYVIGGDTRQQKIFLLVGPRRAGKGTIGRVLTGILGRHNATAPTLASLSTNFGLAPLIGKPLALISDARLSVKADAKVVVERLLSISGEDSLTIDRKYREPWTGRLPSRIVVLTNELPGLTDASGALSSRFIVLVLSTSFLGREDPRLTDALLAEAPSILIWALEGLDRLNRRGHLVMPESGRDAVQQLEDLASPVAAFVRERCSTVRQDASVEVDELWGAWREWCEGQGRGHGTKAVFGRDLHAALPAVKKSRPRDGEERQHKYVGITLAECHDRCDHYDHNPAAGHGGHSGHSNSSMYHLYSGTSSDADPDLEGGL